MATAGIELLLSTLICATCNISEVNNGSLLSNSTSFNMDVNSEETGLSAKCESKHFIVKYYIIIYDYCDLIIVQLMEKLRREINGRKLRVTSLEVIDFKLIAYSNE